MHDFYQELDEAWRVTHDFRREDPNPDRHCLIVQDNARIYTAKHTQDTFQNADMYIMKWPANSPDLNPIKNVCSLLKSRINKRRPRPHTKQEMTDAINEEWENLQPADFQAAIDSMPRRVQLVIEAEDGAIRYQSHLLRLVEIR